MSLGKFALVFVAGILPAVLWLLLWFNTDKHKEPVRLIIKIFLASIIAIFFSLVFELLFAKLGTGAITEMWVNSFIEEFFKLTVVGVIMWKSKYIDEPIDFGIYLVAGALGFAGFENVLFLIDPELMSNFGGFVQVLNVRAIGATVLHAISVLVVGIFYAFAYHASVARKAVALTAGFSLAVVIHFAFNFYISGPSPKMPTIAIISMWVFMVAIFYVYKYISRLK